VSAEAIYTWIYALPKGELAREGILRGRVTEDRPRRGTVRRGKSHVVSPTPEN